jgi:cation diffusion facilitator CzcD-associated flavoprotein CzcO
LIVGAGFAGLGMAIRLKQTGVDDFIILERAGSLGGTWRDNRYPGCACDVESHLYSFSFELNPDWSRAYAPWHEILAYLERTTDKYGIRPHIRFDEAVTRAVFDERTGVWTVETSRGRSLRTRALVACAGPLTRASYPDIPGLDVFRGKVMHSAHWDPAYSVAGKRVAVIGTGASAIQIVPAIAPEVTRLDVYQRTPAWIVPKLDGPISPRAQRLYRDVPVLQRAVRDAIFVRHELLGTGFFVNPRINAFLSRIAVRHMKRHIKDPALQKKLIPSYIMGCKRVLPSNDFYPALARDNVELVTDGIERISERGIVSKDGREREVDAIVLATGFQAAEAMAPFEVRGLGGRDLRELWREGGEAYLGTTIAGFPNAFMIVGPNVGLGHGSMIFMIEAQVRYTLGALQVMRERGLKMIAVREDEQTRYNRAIQARLSRAVWSVGGCVSWYKTRTGKNTTLFPGYMTEFWARTRRFDPAPYELVELVERHERREQKARSSEKASLL